VITGAIGLGYGLLMAGVSHRTTELGWPSVATTAVFSLMSLSSAATGAIVIMRGLTPGTRSALRATSLLSIPFAVATSVLVMINSSPAIPVSMAVFGAALAPLSGISTTVIIARVERGAHARALAFAAAMITIPSGLGFGLAAILLSAFGSAGVLAASAITYAALAISLIATAIGRRVTGGRDSDR
jgi:hypothetical protein